MRLDIFPDGGVARLRLHGEPVPEWPALAAPLDLAALAHGARVLDWSDRFFGAPWKMIQPGPARGMFDGWETRRRRGPGHDWAIVRLACEGVVERVEIDTAFFKGNAPGQLLARGRRRRRRTAARPASGARSCRAASCGRTRSTPSLPSSRPRAR